MIRPWIAALIALTATASADDPSVLRRRYTYREADDGRAVARVELQIERIGGQIALSLAIHCRGAELQPALGAEGVRGENLVTAGEFASLLTPDRHHVESIALDGADAPAVVGHFAAAAHGPLVHRRFDAAAGSFAEQDAGEHVVQVRCRLLHPAGTARFRTTVEVAGRARLAIAWRIDERGAARLEWIGQPTSQPAAWRVER